MRQLIIKEAKVPAAYKQEGYFCGTVCDEAISGSPRTFLEKYGGSSIIKAGSSIAKPAEADSDDDFVENVAPPCEPCHDTDATIVHISTPYCKLDLVRTCPYEGCSKVFGSGSSENGDVPLATHGDFLRHVQSCSFQQNKFVCDCGNKIGKENRRMGKFTIHEQKGHLRHLRSYCSVTKQFLSRTSVTSYNERKERGCLDTPGYYSSKPVYPVRKAFNPVKDFVDNNSTNAEMPAHLPSVEAVSKCPTLPPKDNRLYICSSCFDEFFRRLPFIPVFVWQT